MREFHINSNEAGQRFDKYLKKLLSGAPGSFVYKMLRKKNITLNGKKADGTEKLQSGDVVKLFLSDETFEKFVGNARISEEYGKLEALSISGKRGTLSTSGKRTTLSTSGKIRTLSTSGKRDSSSAYSGFEVLPVVYEDADVLIVNKPAGMLSQKAQPSDVSANEYILSYLIRKGELTEEMMRTFKPSICNRLDRNTSGLLIAGKTIKGLQEMSDALKERTVQKYYRCIVKGEVRESAYINGWLFKDEKKNQVKIYDKKPEADVPGELQKIETEYRPIVVKNGFSELEVHLITGRSHQIRAHLASIGHPIIGDSKYGDKKINERFRREQGIESQMLHAYRMVFADGREVTAPCGEEFACVWNAICGRETNTWATDCPARRAFQNSDEKYP